MSFSETVYNFSAWVVPVLLAITLHEAAHGYAAWLFGDDTAKRAKRISLNPLRHVDRFGTVVLPAILLLVKSPVLFGYAKPVPVNFNALQPQRLGAIMVAAAGPGSNILQALIAAWLLALFPGIGWISLNFSHAILINAALAAFNMLPILPLDGGRILSALLPERMRPFQRLEKYGMLLLLGLLLLPMLVGFDLLGDYMRITTGWIISLVLRTPQPEF